MSHHETIAHEETYRGCKIKLVYDENAQSPREGYDLGTMVCWHRRYNLGELIEALEELNEWQHDQGGYDGAPWRLMRAVLKKAKGLK